MLPLGVREAIEVLLTLADGGLAVGVTLHVLANRTDVRAGAGWIALAWLSPFVGSVVYFLLGINRIERRARRLRRIVPRRQETFVQFDPSIVIDAPHLGPLAVLSQRVSGTQLSAGNRLEPLLNGDAAYLAMVNAIDEAERYVFLCSYIFRSDEAGMPIIEALLRAHQRRVEVRVLLDGIGAGYFRSPTIERLTGDSVPVARFLHSWLPWRMPLLNLRLHKKILVVDGRVGFTGGMNIGAENLARSHRDGGGVQDIQFRIEGPVVADLAATFEQDWLFTTGQPARPTSVHAMAEPVGTAFARGIQSGPDEDVMKIEATLIGAINAARSHIHIVTPYFLPDRTLQMALVFAVLRGVSIDIVIPRRSNHPIIDWSTRAHIRMLVERGCRFHLSEQPFDHSKIMTVDGAWSLVGSVNWDVRSLRLNFEFDLEIWDRDFTSELDGIVERKMAGSERLRRKDLLATGHLLRMRNAAARLLLPYL